MGTLLSFFLIASFVLAGILLALSPGQPQPFLDDNGMLLEAAPPTMTVPLPTSYDVLRDKYMHMLGIGTTHRDEIGRHRNIPAFLAIS